MRSLTSKLEDLCEENRRITYGVVKPGPEVEGGVQFVRGGDIFQGRIEVNQLRTISRELSEQYKRTQIRGGELLISLVGAPGEVAVATEKLTGANIARQVGLVPLGPKVNVYFAMYFLRSCNGRSQLFTRTQGAVQQVINLADLKTVAIPIFSLDVQNRIADILSAYDELIDNNRRRIQLLEQSARLLYEEWFVHHRFPGHEYVQVVDGVPEGWVWKTYSDLFEFLGGFAFKSNTYQQEGRYGIVTIKNVHDAQFVPTCQALLSKPPQAMKKYCLLKTGDVLLSLTGNIGRACIVIGENFLLNQRVAKVVEKAGVPRSFAYWTFSNKSTQKKLENIAYGVAQLNLSTVNLGRLNFLAPTSKLLDRFSEIATPIFEQICALNLSIRELTKARDLLLPRLMNGEIPV